MLYVPPNAVNRKSEKHLKLITNLSIFLYMFGQAPRPQIKKILKSKIIFWISQIGHTVLIICRCEQNELLNKSLKYRFVDKTNAKVILVWIFDLRIFSIYGHGTWSLFFKGKNWDTVTPIKHLVDNTFSLMKYEFFFSFFFPFSQTFHEEKHSFQRDVFCEKIKINFQIHPLAIYLF